jgi:hypothetical protein
MVSRGDCVCMLVCMAWVVLVIVVGGASGDVGLVDVLSLSWSRSWLLSLHYSRRLALIGVACFCGSCVGWLMCFAWWIEWLATGRVWSVVRLLGQILSVMILYYVRGRGLPKFQCVHSCVG